MTLLLLAFAAGLAIGWKQPHPVVWMWLAISSACLVASFVSHVARIGRLAFILLLLCMMFLGAGWITLRLEFVASNDLAALIGDNSTLVRLDGVATRSPELRSRTSGSMARFDYRPPATYFPMRIDGLLSNTGERMDVHGAVLVRVDETVPPFRAGDRVQVTGFLLRPAMPRNPGEFDFRQYAKSLGQAGILTVSGRDLVQVTPAPRGAIMSWFLDWRDDLRRRSSAWLLADMPADERPQRDALLVSLLLGERDAEIDRVYESFQRVGLAHILAISGFHLAVLAGFVMFVIRLWGGGGRAWHGWVVIAAVLLYLLLVEPRMPVLRAGVMTIAGCLGTAFGRRLRVSGLVALSAILLLLWRPDELFNPGFQLTYGVVLALIHLAPPVRERWWGRPNPEAATSAEMIGEWMKTALAASVVAWLAATPIAAYHFGSIALAGIPLSLLAVPLSAVILALGFMKIVIGAILPSAGLLLGVPLTISAELLLAIVRPFDEWRLSSVQVPPPSTLWTFAALAWVCWWSLGLRHETRLVRRLKPACLIALVLWLIAPITPLSSLRDDNDLLRIDMLAVGDGSCYILRSGGETMVFDAGSSTDLNAGTRSIIPAMRRLGIRSVDRICITHANLDHYSAVTEIVKEFEVGEVRVTPQFAAAAQADPLSPLAYLLSNLTEHRVRVIETNKGAQWSLGDCNIECLHPPPAQGFERINDASMVLRITAADRSALMCGDIQTQAMAMLMQLPEPKAATSAPTTSPAIVGPPPPNADELLQDYIHYAIIGNAPLALAYGRALLELPLTDVQLALLTTRRGVRERFDSANARALGIPELRDVASEMARRVAAGTPQPPSQPPSTSLPGALKYLRADILELPHHGSYHDAAIAFVEHVQPSVVMQSTGWTRWQRDRWAPALAETRRLVTVRDGACTVRIKRDGTISVERFLPQGIEAGGAEIE